MQNEHEGYAYTNALRRIRARETMIEIIVGVAMIVIPSVLGFWLKEFKGALEGMVLGVGVGVITGFIPFRV